VNAGSSSLKIAEFQIGADIRRVRAGEASAIASETRGELLFLLEPGGAPRRERADCPDHRSAMKALLNGLGIDLGALDGASHRVVHGGSAFTEPTLISSEVIPQLRDLGALDPNHAAAALAGIELLSVEAPDLQQVACFDTAFHRTMPVVARLLPLPRAVIERGVVRYGFHGLSCEYVLEELRRLDPRAASRRIVIAHLGSGSSMTAVRDGRSIDTTMGFSPTGGLMMGTRSGDLDPGVLVYLARSNEGNAGRLDDIVNRESGLLGVSGGSADLRDLQDRAPHDGAASEAIALYCHLAKKHLGALTAVLGGIDTLVFTGGIGEHAGTIRAAICEHLDYLGIAIDPASNAANAPVISVPGNRVTVRVIATDEERVIAGHAASVLRRRMGHGE
jgi:acetate kinase